MSTGFEPQVLYILSSAFFTQIDHEPLPMGMIYKPWGDLTKISSTHGTLPSFHETLALLMIGKTTLGEPLLPLFSDRVGLRESHLAARPRASSDEHVNGRMLVRGNK